jgi:site-specific DNA recombinase
MTDQAKRLAFWGRVSTEDNQDSESSRGWQLTRAKTLIAPHGGQIVAEFFDIDKSRSIPPQRRPQASALLAALADPHRGFDAVVVGEPQRAFYGNQFGNTFPIFAHYGVPLWVPEVGGPIDPDNEAHDLIMSVFGGVSKGERNRIKIRVRTAMAAQAQIEGRFLGGRPPYGYRLIDAGPHPNPAKAADGKRLHALAIDESAADAVRRIFAEFLAGHGIYAIAERLTADGIPCPSAHDPGRNRHRCGLAWSKSAVRAILMNPRYTGRQVWNRQRKDEVLIDVHDVAQGHMTKMRWNDEEQWIFSEEIVHPPIIDDETFQQAQRLLAAKNARKTNRRPRSTPRPYVLRGLLFCGICRRRMQGSWNNDQPYYRCTFPNEYAHAKHIQHPRAVYLRSRGRSRTGRLAYQGARSRAPPGHARRPGGGPADRGLARGRQPPRGGRRIGSATCPVPGRARCRRRPGRHQPVDHRSTGQETGCRNPPAHPRRCSAALHEQRGD